MTRSERSSSQIMPETIGGQWTTVWSAMMTAGGVSIGSAIALGTDTFGFLSATVLTTGPGLGAAVAAWLDFIVDEDLFIIHEGFYSRALEPSITEFTFVLSGVQIPTMQIEDIYVNEDSITKGYLEVPNVVSPKSQVVYRPRSRRVNLIGSGVEANDDVNSPTYDEDESIAEPFGPIGEAIAKRSFLIRERY